MREGVRGSDAAVFGAACQASDQSRWPYVYAAIANQYDASNVEGSSSVPDNELPGLSANLDFLFAVSGLTNQQAAERLQGLGIRAGQTYLSQLRSGTRGAPSARILHGLRQIFADLVPVALPLDYFFDSKVAAHVQAEIRVLDVLTDEDSRDLLARAAGMTPDEFQAAVYGASRFTKGANDS